MPEEVRRAADLLERRWLLSIVYAAHGGATRFNEFRYALGEDIPPRTLAARLSELEAAGVLRRTVTEGARPPRVDYALTDEGHRLGGLLDALREWAAGAKAVPPATPLQPPRLTRGHPQV